MDFEEIKTIISKYPDGSKLLNEAFTHRSFASENNLTYDNQRLEFLGDAVLELAISTHLYKLYPNAKEGTMTSIRSAMVREETLAGVARKLKLGNKLKTGKGEREMNGHQRASTLADLFEALFGACFLACGYQETERILLEIFEEEFPDPAVSFKQLNPKGRLQELTQKYFNCTPDYKVLYTSGPPHCPHYYIHFYLM